MKKTRAQRAQEIAEAVAESFFKDFSDPANGFRGTKFVWPSTFVEMCGRFTALHIGLAGLKTSPEADYHLGRKAAEKLLEESADPIVKALDRQIPDP